MAYDIVEVKDRNIIVNEGDFPVSQGVTSNLKNGECKILFMEAEDCPKQALCINLIYGSITSICKLLGHCKDTKDSIPCNYEDIYTERKLKTLETKPPCEDIEKIVLPTGKKFEKSHAYVVCKKAKTG